MHRASGAGGDMPVLIVVAVWLHFANRGAGAFFLQERPGLHGKIFKIIKFKNFP